MKHQEDDLQMAFVRYVEMQFPDYSRLLHHSPNGGKRNISEAARFKRMGVRSGFPDLVLYVPNGEFQGLVLELKIHPNKPTENQKFWLYHFEKTGYKVHIGYDIDDLILTFKDFLKPIKKGQL